ncbi:TATA-box-binding protein-like [Anopheles maculipalpis]|uniref:TATA-box-binding protein-like n=1 Tax=Anopheles maculipalpis TaxID=1496333 RepID=UPI0021596F4F|nr:TATA-box-binding protein-like [Anopheles maculipalpis]
MVSSSSFISNSISTTSSAPNGNSSNNSGRSSDNNSNITGSSIIVCGGTGIGIKRVLDVNATTGNNVLNVAKGVYLKQHQQHPHNQLKQQQPSSSGVVSGHHQFIVAGGMINHSSLMFATTTTTTNHQQQLPSVLSSNTSSVGGGGGIVEKKLATASHNTPKTSDSQTSLTSTTNTTTTTTNNTTNSPADTYPTDGTEPSLETKEPNPDNEPQEEQPEIDIVINNVVCSFSVRCHLSLHDIARYGNNVEFRRENGMVTMKLRRPYTTASIWSSGKITCTGATSEHQAKIAARRYSRCLQKLGFNVRFRNFRIVNVLGTCSMPFGIMIVNFSEKYKKDASYEPELHPGVTYKLQTPKATLKIFSTGSITVTAASVAFVQAAIEQIFPLVYEFRKKRTPVEKLAMVKQPPPDFDPHDVDHLIEEDREGALAEAEGLPYWNGTSDDPMAAATVEETEEDEEEEHEVQQPDEDDRTRNNTKAIHKINSIRQNGKKRRLAQRRPSGRAVNDGDSMSDDDICVSDYE